MKRFSLNQRILVDILPIAVLLLIGLLSITWFRGNFLIKSGDSFFGLSPNYQLKIDSYMLYPAGDVALPVPFTHALYPYLSFMAFLNNIGASVIASEKILFYLLFTASGLSMYYLITVIFSRNEQKILIGLTAAILYMMNPFTLINIWGSGLTTIVFAYPLLPLSLALFIRGLNTKKFRYTFLLLIAWLIFSAAVANPAFALPIWIVLLSYLVFYVVLERKNKINLFYSLKFCVILLAGWLLLNLFWILPLLPYLNETYSSAQLSGGYASIFIGTSVSTNILNSLRLQGFWTFYSSFLGNPYFLWASTYLTNPFFVAVSFALPILAFLPLLLKVKEKYVIYMTIVAVCGVFAIKQFNPPLGSLNLWAIENVPYAGMFRDTYEKFGMIVAMSFAFLIGVSVFAIYSRLKKGLAFHNFASHLRFKRYVPVVFVVFFLLVMQLFMFPFWNGDVIYAGGNTQASGRIQVPTYYNEAGDWVNSQSGQFNLLYLPIYAGTFRYVWNGTRYGGSDAIDEYFFHENLILAMWDDSSSLGMAAVESMLSTNGSSDSFGKMLAFMDVKYIVVHDDFDPLYTPVPVAQLTADLANEEGITLVKTFGQIQIYENDFWKPSEVYASSNAVLVPEATGNTAEDLNNLVAVVGNRNFSIGNTSLILSSSSQNEIGQQPGLSTTNYNVLNIPLPVYDGSTSPINWTLLSTITYAARYYGGWKGVIDPVHGSPDMLTIPSLTSGWFAYNSTLVYLTTGNSSLTINSILADGNVASDVVGVWWETGWLGMNTTVNYPITIPADQDAIIQINQEVNNVTLVTAPSSFVVPQSGAVDAAVSYREVNPTLYSVSVNASGPFLLVFSEPYDSNWVASVDGKQVPDALHFMANDVANAWYINETGSYTVTLEFTPQNLFYIGSAVSLTTLILLVAYLGKNKLKTISKSFVRMIISKPRNGS